LFLQPQQTAFYVPDTLSPKRQKCNGIIQDVSGLYIVYFSLSWDRSVNFNFIYTYAASCMDLLECRMQYYKRGESDSDLFGKKKAEQSCGLYSALS